MRFSTTSSCLVQAALSLLLTSPSALGLSVGRRATTCNGHAELCNRSFGNVTFVGAHNSYAVGTNNVATNQDYDVTQQLNDGIRMLQMQAHNNNGTIQLCHSTCLLYNGDTFAAYLAKVKTWLDANPNEVVSLLIVNSDGFKPTDYAAVFTTAGLDKLTYTPPTATLGVADWPTLGTLIDAGTRLITFMDSKASFDSVPYIIDEFTNVWETAFDVTDQTFDCNVNRTKGDSASQMYVINHFLDKTSLFGQPAPDKSKLTVTNAATGSGSLGAHVDTCAGQWSRNPNFMLVDFYEYGGGSVFQVAATANGVTYSPSKAVATPLPDNASGTASGGTTSSSSTPNAAVAVSIGSVHWASVAAVVGGLFFGAMSI